MEGGEGEAKDEKEEGKDNTKKEKKEKSVLNEKDENKPKKREAEEKPPPKGKEEKLFTKIETKGETAGKGAKDLRKRYKDPDDREKSKKEEIEKSNKSGHISRPRERKEYSPQGRKLDTGYLSNGKKEESTRRNVGERTKTAEAGPSYTSMMGDIGKGNIYGSTQRVKDSPNGEKGKWSKAKEEKKRSVSTGPAKRSHSKELKGRSLSSHRQRGVSGEKDTKEKLQPEPGHDVGDIIVTFGKGEHQGYFIAHAVEDSRGFPKKSPKYENKDQAKKESSRSNSRVSKRNGKDVGKDSKAEKNKGEKKDVPNINGKAGGKIESEKKSVVEAGKGFKIENNVEDGTQTVKAEKESVVKPDKPGGK